MWVRGLANPISHRVRAMNVGAHETAMQWNCHETKSNTSPIRRLIGGPMVTATMDDRWKLFKREGISLLVVCTFA